MPGASRGRFAWAAPLLLFLAILLAAGLAFNVANLDTGGEAVPSAPTAGGTPGLSSGIVVNAAQVTVAVAIGLLGFLFLQLLLRRRRTSWAGLARPPSIWDTIATLLGLAFFMALLYLWPSIAQRVQSGANATATPASGSGTGPTLPAVAGLPPGLFLAGSLLAALLVIALVLRPRIRDLIVPPGGAAPTRQKAAAALAATVQELHLGGDVREAILACFRRFCEILGERGITDQASLTPREIEHLAVRRLNLPHESVDGLTTLFEEARYSVHALGNEDRDRAVADLRGIQSLLEV